MFSKVFVIALSVFAVVKAGGGSSYTAVSRPHSDNYKYGIDHHYHGQWHGESHPHGAGGLGDGYGSYSLGGGHVIGTLPQGGYGGYGHGSQYGSGYGYGGGHATSYSNYNLKSIDGGLYAGGYGHGGYGHGASSYSNYNQKSYGGYGHGGYGHGGYEHDGYGYDGYGHDGISYVKVSQHGLGGYGGYGYGDY